MLGTLSIHELTQERYRQFVIDFFERPAARGSVPPDHSVRFEDLDGSTIAKRKRTLNMLIGVLRAALKLAWEDGKFDDPRVWKRLRFVPYEKRRRLQYLTQPEALRLIQACDPDMRDLVLAALYSGLRLKELSRLRVRDVARDGFGLHAATAKTQRSRFVFLSNEGMAHFLRLIDGKALCSRRAPVEPGTTTIRAASRSRSPAPVSTTISLSTDCATHMRAVLFRRAFPSASSPISWVTMDRKP